MSVSNVPQKFGRNESSVRTTNILVRGIRQPVALSTHITSKFTCQVREKTLVETEEALNLWLEDINRKCMPIDGKVLRENALSV
jgi:hypothetical protein